MFAPNKKSYEPNPLMLGLLYFVTFIVIVILVVLACSGELLKQRSPFMLVFFGALACYMTISETIKYRAYTKQRERELAEDDSLVAMIESGSSADVTASTETHENGWPNSFLLRPTYKTKQSLVVGSILGLVLIAYWVYRLVLSLQLGDGLTAINVFLICLIVTTAYMSLVNVVHYLYTKRHHID